MDTIKARWDDIVGGTDDGTAVQQLDRRVQELLEASSARAYETLIEPSQALAAALKPLLDRGGTAKAAELPRLLGLVMDLQQAAAVARDFELEDEPVPSSAASPPQPAQAAPAGRPTAAHRPIGAAAAGGGAPRPVPAQPGVSEDGVRFAERLGGAVSQMDWGRSTAAHEPAKVDRTPPPEEAQEPASQVVFVIDPDSEMRQFLSSQLGQRGYDVRSLTGPADALQAARREAPAVVITELGFPIGEMAGAEAVDQLRTVVQRPFAAVFLSSRGDMTARVRAIRSGSDAYFTKPVDVAKLADKLKLLIRAPIVEAISVLIVDDDETHNILSKAILEKAGMRVATITDPMQLMQFLDAFGPDLILLDLYMPGADGLDLVRVLRQREDTADIPVVFVSGETDLAKQMVAMNLGGDEFLTKPVRPEHLVSMVRTRISRAKALQESIARLEIQDPLTGLYNRRYFYAELEQAMSSAGQGAVLYIELDGRETVERHGGLQQADQLLAQVAKVLRTEIGQEGVLARQTGWVFTLLLALADPDVARARAGAVGAAVARVPMTIGEETQPVSCSIGISLLSIDIDDPNEIIASAYEACRKARQLGGSRVHLDTASRLRMVDDVDAYWRQRITHSLKEQGFLTVYQPIIALHGTRGECYQSLLRMVDSHGDITDAGEFIRHAELSGLVVDVDRWTAWNAARQLVARTKESKPITLFVPTSLMSALSEGYLGWIRKLKSSGIPPHSLVLELDTAAAAEHLPQVQEFIAQLGVLEVSVCLTGFGVREDAFSIARRLPAAYLKLNRSLVEELTEQGRERSQLPGVVAEAHKLDRSVIVPFVSDSVTMSPLWHSDVDYVQGYFIQKPSEALFS